MTAHIAALSLPAALNQIDAATVNALIGHKPGRALHVEVGDAQWGTATKVRLRVQWDEAGRAGGLPTHLMLKGGFADHREMMAYLYKMEVRFYSEIRPWLGINSPLCIGSGHDERAHQHLVLLEDLDAAGARFFRVIDPIGEAEARAYLDVMAQMHARTWESPEFAPGGRLADLPTWQALPMDARGDYARGQLEPEVWARYMNLPRSIAVSRLFHDRTKMRAALLRIDAYTRDKPRCFLHGDFHLGNLYTDQHGRPCVLDWQSYAIGHWSHDVTCFLVSALDMADRRRLDRGLIAYYLDRLATHGVAVVPKLDQALEAYRIQIADYLYYWMVNPPEWQTEENNCAVAPRFAAAALDHGTFDDL